MKKLLLMGSLLTAMAAQAQEQITFYWPNERVTELTDGGRYFIYNTAYDVSSVPNDRGSFLYAQENGNFGTLAPKQYANVFVTQNANYTFQIYKKADAENVYQIKNATNSWINFNGAKSENAVDFYIKPWATSDAPKGNMEAKMDDGTRTSDLDNAKVWTVTNNASNSTAWNGNGGFTTWGMAHPYAFYSVKSVELTGEDEIKCYNEINNRNGMISDIAWSLQTLYGKVKDGNKYFSNHPETTPAENSSYAHLVDGNDNTYFHSSWSASGTDKHYLRAELPEATKDFYIITKRRTNVNSNRPTSMLVEGSDAAEGTYTAITTLTELPVLENEYYYFSDKISSDAAYQYIRFTAQATNNGNAFFTFSEFYVIESNPETDAYMAQIKAFYHNEAARNPKDENFVNSFDAAKYNAVAQIQEALRLTLAKNAITTLIEENADKHAADPALGQYPTEAYNALKAVAENPDATSAELNEAITTFKFSINAPVFTINGAFNGGYQTIGKSIYYKADDATNPLWWNKTTNKYDKSMLWKFAGSTSTTAEVGQTYTAMNMAENVYFWNVEQLNVTETNPTNTDGIVLIKTAGNSTPVHADSHGYIVRWNNSEPTSASAWTIEYVGESFKIDQINDDQMAAYANLKTLIPECEPYVGHIGDGLNQYSCEGHDFAAALAKAKEISSQDIYQNPTLDAVSAQTELQAAKNALAINMPEAGKYYRIKSKTTGKYIVSYAESGRPAMQEDGSDQTTVFYLSADKRLTGYASLNMSGNGNFYNDGGHTFNFTASPVIGYYAIRQTSNANGYLFDYSATNGKLDNWSNPSDERCAWILEEVNEPAQQPKLNKQMTAEYATLAAPVALNIPAGVKAYTVTVDETKESAILEEVSEVIPAGTAVILKKEGAESSFDFTYAPEGSTENSNSLVGVYKTTDVAADINAYILGNGSNGIGFYQMSADDRSLGANKAYLALPATMSQVRSITIGGPTTGIENTVTDGTQTEEYYDLQGRRVLNPTKGIYVTKSGKKVLFNK